MAERNALSWTHRNRSRSDRTHSAGAMLEALTLRMACGEASLATEVACRISGLVDAEFRRHCTIADLIGGRLIINVDEVPLAYSFRLRWGAAIERELRGRRGAASVTRVVFEYGSKGVRIPEPAGG